MTEQETMDAIRKASQIIGADADRMRRLSVFLDMWPDIDAYTPPADVAHDVHQIVMAFRHLASVVTPAAHIDKESRRDD